MFHYIKNYLYILAISVVPLIELRGAVPAGAVLGLPWYANLLLSCIGNMLPVPFILLFIRQFVTWLERHGYMKWFTDLLERKIRKNIPKITKYAGWGLLIFVGIPLPGTGAWTGALIAAFIDMPMKRAVLSIAGGVLLAGIIMTIASYSAVGFLQFLL